MSVLGDNCFLILRPETAWSIYSGETDLPHPFYNGSYGVTLKDPVRIQPHNDGSLVTRYGVQDMRDLDGALEVGLYPATAGALLDWAWLRAALSGDGESFTGSLVKPGVEMWRDLGLKVGGFSLAFTDGDDLKLNLTTRGRYRTDVAPSGSPPALPVRGDFTWPTFPSYTFSNLKFLVSLDAAAAVPVEIVPAGFESGTLNGQNNLIPGQHVQDLRTGFEEINGAIEFLKSGGQSIDGSFVVLLDSDDYHDAQKTKKEVSLRIMGTHQTAAINIVDAAGASAGSSVAVPVTGATANFSVGDYVFFQTATAASMSVAKIESIAVDTSITVDTLRKDVVSGDFIFNKAIEFFMDRGKLSEVSDDLSPGSVVKSTLNFTAINEDGLLPLFSYQAGGMA